MAQFGCRISWTLAGVLLVFLSTVPALADQRTPMSIEVYKPDLVYQGTTVFVDMTVLHAPRVVEIDFQGNVVWSYDVPRSFVGDPAHDLVTVQWLPEADHFLIGVAFAGAIEVDRAKHIVWSYRTKYLSHDLERLANGNTLFPFAWEDRYDAQVSEIDPAGKTVWQWFASHSLPEAQNLTPGKRDARAVVDANKVIKGTDHASAEGFMHANAAYRLPNGNTLISLRNYRKIIEVDPAGRLVWSREAPGTHKPEALAGGGLLMNLSGRSRVVEVERTGQVTWMFATERYGGGNRYAHRLPNGNTLIATENQLLEVTPRGDIAWQVRMKDMPEHQDRANQAETVAWEVADNVLYNAGRIPARDSADRGKWWNDPASRPATARMAAMPAASASPVAARGGADGASSAAGLFARFDADHDGVVTHDEFLAARRNILLDMDTNQDGNISRDEFLAHAPAQVPPPRRTMLFEGLDTNRDDRISPDEIERAAELVFKRLDRRGDGRLTTEDFGEFQGPPPMLLFGGGLPAAIKANYGGGNSGATGSGGAAGPRPGNPVGGRR